MFEYGDDKPKEECGVFGIYAPDQEVARLTYYGLYALQHRGQESAGIAVSDGRSIDLHKGMGLVSEVFSDSIVEGLKGKMAIGHVRYSTTGSSLLANAQPLVVHYQKGMMALAHNGNLTNASDLREELGKKGAVFQTTVDTEAIINLISRYRRDSFEDALVKTMMDLRGAYALVILAEDKLFGIRDPHGVRPLCIGRLGGCYCLASESCALDTIGAEFVRDVEPGEIVVIDEEGLHSRRGLNQMKRAACAFEYIYFARPDSTMDQLNIAESRRQMGIELARECPIDADLVIAVPDSGTASALGYATALGIPFGEGLIKNRYVGRTFIQPTQAMREVAVRLKLNANTSVLKDKRVVMIDDSIVRGTTSSKLVEMVKKAGAKEVHFLISSPPVAYPCFYGIDTAEREKLIANRLDVEGIRKYVGADSLHYISEEGLLRALGTEDVCLACFNGAYPISVSSLNRGKNNFEI
ncbi:amidophosphoribosyltransferase [Desulfosporosinus sp.]|uniref:amidophosphoribosyltransferase n=1 Tax=Desulfosporosinus sp. TaxID=157907 RepID=UPI000E97435D|nr:amidophosphoribosyltransferase [Desulfosporosinus sp.]MBC2722429.1 amidophosphoribosyltransferase [Desulfosporosinus sp.]MBC2727546.1 amidophosphoribosyltransferase [Desulfosporosinus sp.]HBV87777.1 amidophosphoribosyltransferase [Desulfosporosinus sp.]